MYSTYQSSISYHIIGLYHYDWIGWPCRQDIYLVQTVGLFVTRLVLQQPNQNFKGHHFLQGHVTRVQEASQFWSCFIIYVSMIVIIIIH